MPTFQVLEKPGHFVRIVTLEFTIQFVIPDIYWSEFLRCLQSIPLLLQNMIRSAEIYC